MACSVKKNTFISRNSHALSTKDNILYNGGLALDKGILELKSQYNDKDLSGTEHGVMYAYDTHIPLIWYGWKIKPGKTNREVYMTDVAPTISALLKIQMPGGSVGEVLGEVVD